MLYALVDVKNYARFLSPETPYFGKKIYPLSQVLITTGITHPCVWSVKSQEYKSFEIDAVTMKISMTEKKEDIYDWIDWISSFNIHVQAGLPFILTAVNEGYEYKSLHLSIFTSLKNDAFKMQFYSELHFYTLSKTMIAFRTMQLRVARKKQNAILPTVYACNNWYQCMRYM